jgi:L-threonylcarbamoyladenylate synthase
METSWSDIANILRNGGVAVVPTDTLYGIVARVANPKAVERIYKIKGREKGKPCIVLLSSFDQLNDFGVDIATLTGGQWSAFLHHIWPGKVSVVLPCGGSKWKYLHRGTGSIAFRMVGRRNRNLYGLINNVGPLVAPSANPAGLAPATTMLEAQNYFNTKVDGYVGGKSGDTSPSTLVSLLGPKPKILRQGSVDIYKK